MAGPLRQCSSGYFSTGLVTEYADRVHKELTIGSIQIDTERKDCPVRYMCRETGVGSGTLWEESCLFATEEEASAYGASELARVIGRRQEQELKREQKKGRRIYKRSG